MTESLTESEYSVFDASTTPFGPSALTLPPIEQKIPNTSIYQQAKLLPAKLYFKTDFLKDDDEADLTQTPLTTPAKPRDSSTFFPDDTINFVPNNQIISRRNSQQNHRGGPINSPNLNHQNSHQNSFQNGHQNGHQNEFSNGFQPNNRYHPNLNGFHQNNGFHPNPKFRNPNLNGSFYESANFDENANFHGNNNFNPQHTALPQSAQNTPLNNGRSFSFPEDTMNGPAIGPASGPANGHGTNLGSANMNSPNMVGSSNNGPTGRIQTPIQSPNKYHSHSNAHNNGYDFRNYQPYKAIRQFCNEIFIGNLPKNLTRDEIYKQLRNYDLGGGLHLYIKQFKQPRCTARRDAKGCLVLNVGYAFIVTKTQEMSEKLIGLKYIKLKQLDGTMVKAEISPIDSYKRDKGHKDWESQQDGEGSQPECIDSGMGINDGVLSANSAFGDDALRTQFELCSINETGGGAAGDGSAGDGAPIQSVFDSIPRL